MKVNFLDCCSDPDIEAVKILLDTNRERESLCQCKTCGAYWFHRFFEIMKFDRADDQTVWYSPVTEEEAQRILNSEYRPDLKFLLNRPSFMKDDKGIHRVAGQPDEPYYG